MPNSPNLDRQLSPTLRVQQYDISEGSSSRPASTAHRDVELTWVTAGEARYRIGSRELEVGKGAAVLVPAGVEHATTLSTVAAGSLKLGTDAYAELCDAFSLSGLSAPTLVAAPRRLLLLGRLLRRELEAPSEDRDAAEALCEAMAIEALRREPARPASRAVRSQGIRAALDRIEAHFAQPLTVAELAKTAGMSRFHFSRCFKDEVGSSPYRRLLAVRVERAAELLRRGGSNVTEVAFEVGFQDLGRFSQAFRNHLGVRPSDYLRDRTIRMTKGTIRGDRSVALGY